jgi:hypothetical protein
MNAQDNHLDFAPRDADLLASIDRALSHLESVPHNDPHSFEGFCIHLAGTTPTADPIFRELLDRRLASALEQRHERSGALARPRRLSRVGLRAPWQTARRRLTSLILAVLVAGGGIGAYLHGQGPTPVDAQTVLHRAAAVSPGPNEAIHATYRLSASGGLTGSADVWVGFDGSGAPTQLALTQTMFKDGAPASDLSTRVGAAGQSLLQAYDPARHPVTIPSSVPPGQALEGMLAGTLLAQKLGRQPSAFKLQQQSLDGVPVYALKLDDSSSQTFYFNAQSYVLEGVDWVQDGKSWQARLDPASYHTMALSAVPPHTFPATGSGPTTSVERGGGQKSGSGAGGVSLGLSVSGSSAHLTISVSVGGLKGSGVDIMPAMTSACNTTPQAFTTALHAGDKSMLAVCQETNAGMSADSLVTALMAPIESALDAQVTSGAITSVQESSDLANVRTQLTHLVTARMRVGQGQAGIDVQQP